MNSEDHLDPSISKLYQAIPKAKPSAKIDVAVLAQAREVIHRSVSKRQKMHYQRWWLPLSTAALLVMGLSVTIRIMHQPESMSQIPVPISVPISKQELKIDTEGERPQALRQDSIEDEIEERPSAAASMPTLTPAPVMMFEAEMDGMNVQEAPAKEKKAVAARARTRSSESRVERERMDNRGLLKRAPPNRLPAASGVMAIQSDSSNEAATAPLSEVPAEPVWSEREWSSPEAWLRNISDLLANGKKSEAISELKNFRSNYPDYQLPGALQRLSLE